MLFKKYVIFTSPECVFINFKSNRIVFLYDLNYTTYNSIKKNIFPLKNSDYPWFWTKN